VAGRLFYMETNIAELVEIAGRLHDMSMVGFSMFAFFLGMVAVWAFFKPWRMGMVLLLCSASMALGVSHVHVTSGGDANGQYDEVVPGYWRSDAPNALIEYMTGWGVWFLSYEGGAYPCWFMESSNATNPCGTYEIYSAPSGSPVVGSVSWDSYPSPDVITNWYIQEAAWIPEDVLDVRTHLGEIAAASSNLQEWLSVCDAEELIAYIRNVGGAITNEDMIRDDIEDVRSTLMDGESSIQAVLEDILLKLDSAFGPAWPLVDLPEAVEANIAGMAQALESILACLQGVLDVNVVSPDPLPVADEDTHLWLTDIYDLFALVKEQVGVIETNLSRVVAWDANVGSWYVRTFDDRTDLGGEVVNTNYALPSDWGTALTNGNAAWDGIDDLIGTREEVSESLFAWINDKIAFPEVGSALTYDIAVPAVELFPDLPASYQLNVTPWTSRAVFRTVMLWVMGCLSIVYAIRIIREGIS